MSLLLGLDVGTSSLKAVAYDPGSGRIVAQAARPTPVSHPQADRTDFDPIALWDGVSACIRTIIDTLPSSQSIAAVAVASMGEAGVPLDQNGEPLYPIIAWFDTRSEAQAARLRRELGAETIHRITGQKVRSTFAASKILWLKDTYPALMARLALWLSVEDYILWRLSAVPATDYSVASRTMLLDQERGDWSPEMLAACGLTTDALPRPVQSGTVIGRVTKRAAQETGLAIGTPVATGGHDHLCGALAVGAVETGRFLDSSGTAQSMLMAVDRFYGGGQTFAHGFSCYRHVLYGRYIVQGGLNTAGGALEWIVTLTSGGHNAYTDLYREAEESGPGARGVICLPYFRGLTSPFVEPQMRAAFVGLTLEHRRGDLMRAVIEGLAYHLRLNLEHMAQVAPVAEGHLLAIGGANREPLILQIKADVCNRPLVAAGVPEATAVGAALLAGLAVGIFGDEKEAASSVACEFRRYEPTGEAAALYDREYHRYGQLISRLHLVYPDALAPD